MTEEHKSYMQFINYLKQPQDIDSSLIKELSVDDNLDGIFINYHEIFLKLYARAKSKNVEPKIEVIQYFAEKINNSTICSLSDIIIQCTDAEKLIAFAVALRNTKDIIKRKMGIYCFQYMFTKNADEKDYLHYQLRALDDAERDSERIFGEDTEDGFKNAEELFSLLNSKGYSDTDADSLKKIWALLIKGVNLETKFSKGNTCLMICAQKGYYNALRLIAKFGADIDTVNEHLSTPCMWASRKSDKILDYLGFMGADVNKQCSDGDTALISATRHVMYLSIEILLKYNAFVNQTNNANESALTIARAMGNQKLVNLYSDILGQLNEQCNVQDVEETIQEHLQLVKRKLHDYAK